MEHVHPLDIPGVRAQIIKVLGVSQQSITNWKAGSVPVIHCTAIEQATSGAVTRQDLRPNDWQAIWPELDKPARKPKQAAQVAQGV